MPLEENAQRFHPIDYERLRPIQLQLVGGEPVPKSQVVDAQLAQVLAHPSCAQSSTQLSHADSIGVLGGWVVVRRDSATAGQASARGSQRPSRTIPALMS